MGQDHGPRGVSVLYRLAAPVANVVYLLDSGINVEVGNKVHFGNKITI